MTMNTVLRIVLNESIRAWLIICDNEAPKPLWMAAVGMDRAARTAGPGIAGLRDEREDRSAKENLQQEAARISIPAPNQISRFQSIMPVSVMYFEFFSATVQ